MTDLGQGNYFVGNYPSLAGKAVGKLGRRREPERRPREAGRSGVGPTWLEDGSLWADLEQVEESGATEEAGPA